MKSYILFVYGQFDDTEDLQFFLNDILGQIDLITDVRFIIQNFENIIVIFSSNSPPHEIDDALGFMGNLNQINYYIMFKLENIVSFILPDKLKDIIFKPNIKDDYDVIKIEKKLDLDEILEKISKNGLDSISDDERKFLNDFGF
jgi:hypothetical protein